MAKKILHFILTTAIVGAIVWLATYGIKTYSQNQTKNKMRDIIHNARDKS